MSSVLKTTKLTKDYGDHKGAFDVDISLDKGEIVGFIGPNGAGKTTALDMMGGFITRTSGDIEILGNHMSIFDDWAELYQRIGFLPGEITYSDDYTARTLLDFSQRFYRQNYSNSIKEYAKRLSLDLDLKIKSLSQGNKRKVGVINALYFNPELVILDEPTSGLDPLVQQEVLDMLMEVRDSGGTVLLSSHNLTEVQRICDRIIMIKNGDIILKDTRENILDQAVTIFRLVKEIGFKDKLKNLSFIDKIEHIGSEVILYTKENERLIKFLVNEDYYDFYIERPNLENMFLESYA